MTRREALLNTLEVVEPYLKMDDLTDSQAAKIGRTLYSNLRQADRDRLKRAFEETIETARPLLRRENLTLAEQAQLGNLLYTNLQKATVVEETEGI